MKEICGSIALIMSGIWAVFDNTAMTVYMGVLCWYLLRD